MGTLSRALSLYWGVYALDFITSGVFIALGYGYAETNQLQRALITTPGLAPFVPWLANQAVWIGVGALGLAALAASPSFISRKHVGMALAVLSFVRLYGVATNVGFTLSAVVGFELAPTAWFVILSMPAMALFMGDLMGYAKSIGGPTFKPGSADGSQGADGAHLGVARAKGRTSG